MKPLYSEDAMEVVSDRQSSGSLSTTVDGRCRSGSGVMVKSLDMAILKEGEDTTITRVGTWDLGLGDFRLHGPEGGKS